MKSKIKIVKRPENIYIFSPEKGDLFETNEIGEVIVNQLNDNKDEEQIVEYLHKETGMDKKTIQKDVKKFIHELNIKGF